MGSRNAVGLSFGLICKEEIIIYIRLSRRKHMIWKVGGVFADTINKLCRIQGVDIIQAKVCRKKKFHSGVHGQRHGL